MRSPSGHRLATMLVALGTIALLVTGCSDDEPGSTGATDPGAPVEQEPPAEATIDECLVGVWSTVSYSGSITIDGRQLVVVDLQRILTFAADGVEQVDYSDPPAVVQDAAGVPVGEATYTGSFTYQVTTEGTMMGFELVDGSVSGTLAIDGTETSFDVNGESAPVSYTCDGTEHTQSASGYEAAYTRAT